MALVVLVLLPAGCGGAAFDSWAIDVCERNDALDREAEQTLPKTDITDDMNYLEKVQSLVERKLALKAEVDAYDVSFTRSALRNKLSISLNNSIRYLRTREAQYTIAQQHLEALKADEELPADMQGLPGQANDIMRSLVTSQAAYQVDPKEVLMKRQYEKLYSEVRVQLGLPPITF